VELNSFIIRNRQPEDDDEWLRLRRALWPDSPIDEQLAEMKTIRQDPHQLVFVLERQDGRLGGFVEANLRSDADGCSTHPVGYIEAWYIDPDLRRLGFGRRLVAAAEAWAVEMGCREMASDAELWNQVSLKAHLALGYEEVGRVIQFRKALEP
jgi:aminoglycoside 6'-N-acetyltransferase I